MIRIYGMIVGLLLVAVLLLGMPHPGSAAFFGKSVFSDVGDAMRDADNARDGYHKHRSGRNAARYERAWYDSEDRLEEVRVRRMSRETKASAHEVQRMRESGRSWKDICDRYRIGAQKMGYGHKGPHGYDRDHDRDLQRRLYKKDHHPGKGKGKGH